MHIKTNEHSFVMVLFSANAHPADSPLLVLFLFFHSVLLQLLYLRVPLLATCWFLQ